MNTDLAIAVRGLSKRFELYDRPIDMLWELMTRRSRHRDVWVLSDLEFGVAHGEAVGVVGRNGAGKSTLLKILAGTLEQTRGSVQINGRVASILELGTGFHPDYTGRDNILVGGLYLGMTREEVLAKLDWIIAFSELGAVIDRPFKTYSTGMQARLAYSTAASIEPDILIVDEALSVGDAKFQRKCYRHMEDLRGQGRTILFVSHDPRPITGFCDRALLLEGGRLAADGDPRSILNRYHKMLFDEATGEVAATPPTLNTPDSETRTIPVPRNLERLVSASEVRAGDRKAEIYDVAILDAQGQPTPLIETRGRYRIVFWVYLHEAVNEISFGFRIATVQGVEVYGTNTNLLGIRVPLHAAGYVYEAAFELDLCLAPGRYFLTVGAARNAEEMYDRRADVLDFTVAGDFNAYSGSLVNLNAKAAVQAVQLR